MDAIGDEADVANKSFIENAIDEFAS